MTPARLGTAYGLMTMLQNIGTLPNLGAGWLNDSNGAGPDNPAGYTPMLWMFMLIALGGFVFAAALRARETSAAGHGLETISATGLEALTERARDRTGGSGDRKKAFQNTNSLLSIFSCRALS